jgi:hypothetical protein
MDVPPVPTPVSPLAAAALMLAEFTSSGSALTRNIPSTEPASISLAIASSISLAFPFTSFSEPEKTAVGLPSTILYRLAGVVEFAWSIDALAATNRTWDTVIPAADACRTTSSMRFSGSLPPRLKRFPPLEPISAIFFGN